VTVNVVKKHGLEGEHYSRKCVSVLLQRQRVTEKEDSMEMSVTLKYQRACN